MKHFSNRMLPESQFHNNHEEYNIASLVDTDDGAAGWTTMRKNALKWNPEQNFDNDNNKIHVQYRKNIKLIDEAVRERLQSVSLVVTSLLTSLHDTTMYRLNEGFKVA